MPIIPGGGGFLVPHVKKEDKSFGLLTSIKPIHLPDPHWQVGFEFEIDCSIEVGSTLPPCPDPVAAKAVDGGLLFCSADPFSVYGSYKCSTGGRPPSESIAIASNRLNKNKERGVEKIFWTGLTPVGIVNPSLQGGNNSCGLLPIDVTPQSGALTPVGAIAALESNITECIPGGIGVYHVTYGFLPYMTSNLLAKEKEGLLHTPAGQVIIAGAGYPGTGPGNVPAAPGETWIFMTGPVSVYCSDVFNNPTNVNEGIDRAVNSVTFFVEQTYSVVWECCVFCCRVNLC